jgi:hypothetical protein
MKKSKKIIKQIYKKLESKPKDKYHAKDEIPIPPELLEALKEDYPIGKKIILCLAGGNHDGEILGYNVKDSGFYPGVRYPVLIKRYFDDQIFEYGLDQIKEK